MTIITKGANTPVPTGQLRVAVCRRKVPGAPAVEVSALLLDAAGKVRGDADLVFHGQPTHPAGAVRHIGTGDSGDRLAEWLELDLPRMEPEVQRVLIAGSCDDGTFGQVPGLAAQTVAPDGAIVAHYEVTDAAAETAFVLGEFYRRNGEWKFRAVGQGYDSGLAGLATDFGIVVAREPAPAVAAPPASGPVPLTGVSKSGAAPAEGFAPAARVPSPSGPAAAPPATAVPAASLPSPAVPTASAPAVAATVPASSRRPAFFDHFDFEPVVRSGKGSAKNVTMDIRFPPNSLPVIMEARVEGYQWIQVEIPGRDDTIFCHDLPEHRGRVLFTPPRKGGPLKLKVSCSGEWMLKVLPLSAALPMGAGTITGTGPEVLVYTGNAAELKVRAKDPHSGWFRINQHRGEDPEEFRHPQRLVHAWNGKRVRETVDLPDGPLLVSIDKSRHEWELTTAPLPPRTPAQGGAPGLYTGRSPETLTLVNPRPGRPSLVAYEFKGATRSHDVGLWAVDEYGDETEWINTYGHGVRGTGLTFTAGTAERPLRVKHSGEWSLRLLPEEQAPLITGRTEGRGTTVLRYQGPPTLMTLHRTSRKKDGRLQAHAANHPFGKTAIIADVTDRHRPALGPVWVDPGGSCFVVVLCPEDTKWRLEPAPFDEAPVLGPRTQGTAYGVVRHIGPPVEVTYASTGGIQHLYQLDENLFPAVKVTATSGPYRVSEGILQVRALGEWVIEKRG
ncbi:TerD family protein [Streptomyces sp. NPDC000983]|uniref:TerD family protein n=1 Tax=Streptomyces sp. NPDC000983 TaxID=3154373 RepID=UPI0033238DAA